MLYRHTDSIDLRWHWVRTEQQASTCHGGPPTRLRLLRVRRGGHGAHLQPLASIRI